MRRVIAILLVLICASGAGATILKSRGSTDVSIQVLIKDNFGDPNTAIVVTALDLYYIKDGAAISAKIDCTALAAADSAHTDGGAFHKGYGVVRIDPPDLIFTGAVESTVVIVLESAGNQTVYTEIQIGSLAARDANDVYDLAAGANGFVALHALVTDANSVLHAHIGDPNSADSLAGDLVVLEAKVNAIKSDTAAVKSLAESASYGFEALKALVQYLIDRPPAWSGRR